MADYADILFGNLAYDTFSGTAVPEYAPPLPQDEPDYERPAERPEEQAVPVPQTVPARRQYVSPFAVVGTLCVAAVMVMLLLSYIRLTAISNESVRLERQISALEDENTKLQIAYESAFKLEDVEAYAMSELGMVKAEQDQVMYINNTRQDRAVILDAGRKNGAAGKIGAYLRKLVEYIG